MRRGGTGEGELAGEERGGVRGGGERREMGYGRDEEGVQGGGEESVSTCTV